MPTPCLQDCASIPKSVVIEDARFVVHRGQGVAHDEDSQQQAGRRGSVRGIWSVVFVRYTSDLIVQLFTYLSNTGHLG